MGIQGRQRRRAVALAAIVIASGAWVASGLGAASAASTAIPALTLSLERGATRVAWRFTPLSNRDGSALDIERRVGASGWVRISHHNRPRPTGAFLDRYDGTGLISYRAHVTAPGLDAMSTVATIQVGPTTTSTIRPTTSTTSTTSTTLPPTTTTTSPPPPQPACTRFVSTSGSDANPGTSSAPLRTISHAEATASPGQVVCVRGGVYSERVNLTRAGTANARLTVTGAPGETAIVDGATLPIGGTDGLFNIAGGADYLTVQNLTIRNSSGRGLVNDGSHNRVLDTTITNIHNAGLLTTNWSAAATDNEYAGNDISYTVQGNDCHSPADPCQATGGWESAINHYNSGPYPFGHNIVRANRIHDNDGEGMTVADYEVVVGNTVFDNFSVDIYLDGTQHATIEKNLVYESETARPAGGPSAYRLLAIGIALADENSPRNSTNTIRNNVVLNTSTGINFWRAASGSGLVDDIFDNNTIVNTWNCGICFDAGAHAGTLLRGNLVIPRSGSVTSGTAASGVSAATNLFTSRGASNDAHLPGEGTFSLDQNDYRLQPTSLSAIDKGVTTSAGDDVFGTPRPQGSAYDIGAHELRSVSNG
jgi:hypothetical protein